MDGVPFGDYLLLGRLAAGGMAEVFLAKGLLGPASDLYAVKRTLPHLADHSLVLSMFADEARIVSGLKHENIATIYDRGGTLGQLYIVMEFVHGRDLQVIRRRARKRGEPLSDAIIAHVIARMASALDYAHRLTDAHGRSRHIVHRDVSPQNILISYAGYPKLIDFGIAKARDRMAETQSGVVKGKYNYMSPEQARGDAIDWRTDIFALGITLYELLTGKLPFAGNSRIATLQNTARGEYISVHELDANVPTHLVDIVDTAMARDREQRYQAAADMQDDLEAFLSATGEFVDHTVMAATMRELFGHEYQREREQITELVAIAPPAEAVAAAQARFPEITEVDARPPWIEDDDTMVTAEQLIGMDTTQIRPSPELAAGFPVDGPFSEEGDTVCDTPSWGKSPPVTPAEVVELANFESNATETRDFGKEIGESSWQTTGASEPAEYDDDERGDTLIVEMPDFLDPDDDEGSTTEVVESPYDDEPTRK